MSNPTYASGNITRAAGAEIEKYRLVKLNEGKVEHNDAATFPFGAVTEGAAPEHDENLIGYGKPKVVRVHTDKSVVKLETEATGFTDGAVVYAAADGKVAPEGTVAIGLADRPEQGNVVRVHLFHPAALAQATA